MPWGWKKHMFKEQEGKVERKKEREREGWRGPPEGFVGWKLFGWWF